MQKSDIDMYSKYNEGKPVIAEGFTRTLKSKSYKYMASMSKNIYIDKLNDIVNKYNNKYHSSATKMRPVNVKSNTYINSSKEINDKNPKFKISDIVRILKRKNIFGNVYTTNWSEEDFVIKKFKTTLRCY